MRPGSMIGDSSENFALYVHWPFCVSKCPYCDFNSHVAEAINHKAWRDLLCAEIDFFADEFRGRTLQSIFFGGGTPSLMDPETARAIIERARRHWSMAADIEITLEANPSSAETKNLEHFHAAGINRLSLGIQSLDDNALRFLGRAHDRAEALKALDTAHRIFRHVSFDLIAARPGLGLQAWLEELNEALSFSGEHLSIYQLTVEKGTPFFTLWRDKALVLPGEEESAIMFRQTREHLAKKGFEAYEISNHARPGAQCRHNMIYWRYGDYLGIGPGAHSRVTPEKAPGKIARQQISDPWKWQEAVAAQGAGTRHQESLDPATCGREMLIMGLRLKEGVRSDRFLSTTRIPMEEALDPDAIAMLERGGMLWRDNAGLRLSEEGFLRLDAILEAIVL